mmetsp:Transcript_3213/g.4685  ORF Transcript_3213/g.4685 Transcript_3213/m.4685 type:complete len:266 (+) Transcript_3213:764-1561(+)
MPNFVVRVPKQIASLQHVVGRHVRMEQTWADYAADAASQLAEFIHQASLPPNERKENVTISGAVWSLRRSLPLSSNSKDDLIECSNEYWVVYTSSTKQAVLAFRGGDGGVEDAKHHLGSPASAFLRDEDEEKIPASLPLDIVRQLGQSYALTICGYSQGGISALACALAVRAEAWLSQCVLMNCATVFWPPWFKQLLPEDWWTNPPDFTSKITSWVVRDDFLSEGSPGNARAPQVPGTTVVLPTCAIGSDIMKNHEFINFYDVPL